MTPKPEDMQPDELRRFVRQALAESKRRPLPEDLLKWYESVNRIRDRDLRRTLKGR